jgi:transglutaminase-like putative cysteine protease
MTAFQIVHRTAYRYDRRVGLGPHRLMLRPRDGRELRVLSCELEITPRAEVSWSDDVFGNAVAIAQFAGETDTLAIISTSKVERLSAAWPVFPIAASAISYPFRYSDDERLDLGALTMPTWPDPEGTLGHWTAAFVRGHPTDTLSLLKDLSAGIPACIRYEAREDGAARAPLETLRLGLGSCRDYATLFIEAVRILGLGARLVSGYLCDFGAGVVGTTGSGSTHAWAEVFVPGAGWITFDPTNRQVGGANLIPVAVSRDIGQAMPVTGSFVGPRDALENLTVEVSVTAI